MPREKKGGIRIDAVVETEDDRDQIYRAADEAQQSIRVFVGQAALRAASPEGMQMARLEHITQVQEKLTAELEMLKAQLQELSANLATVVKTSAKSVAQHDETHKQLAFAIAQRERLQSQLTDSLRRQEETHGRLIAMLGPIENTSRAVTEGLAKVSDIHLRMGRPDEMDSVRMACRMMARIMDHLGIKLEDED